MGSLLAEYRRRHQSNFIWAANDGVCFFNRNKKPRLIATISDTSRGVAVCRECPSKSHHMTCDVVAIDAATPNTVRHVWHSHVLPDTDLQKIITKIDSKATPFFSRHSRDVEVWLWNFFLMSNPLAKSIDWKDFLASQVYDDHLLNGVDQMMWCASNAPSVYQTFYEYLYQRFLIGRNYLLIK